MTLEILTADRLAPLRHGFFTRKGGASSGIFAGLNCGAGSSDQRQVVAINRARAAAALALAREDLISLNQVHSAEVVTLDAPPEAPPRADAMVTAQPGLGLAVLTADCQPVLMADAQNGVIGAVHAGWRGTLAGILEATVAAMEALGAKRAGINAVIGPTISQPAYEVGPDFFAAFMTEDPDSARYFSGGRDGHAHFDLPGYGLRRLRAAGVGHAEWTRHCTYSDASLFYSCRRAAHRGEADYGRLLSAIRL